MKQYLTVGLAVLAGAALVEAALIPGLVIGGAAMLAPKMLPILRRRIAPLMNGAASGDARPATQRPAARGAAEAAPPTAVVSTLGIKQAIAKTVTFRVIVTALDFTSNYIVIGEFNVAAGLSTFALVVGPLFYLVHETAWNYFHPGDGAVDVSSFLPLRSDAAGEETDARGITISRALAKTITFRTIATAMDFTTLYVVVGDPLTAVGLAAWGFVAGPFVYWGHEKLWERFNSPEETGADLPEPAKLLPAPANA
jgi:uncharacterized membrane protein